MNKPGDHFRALIEEMEQKKRQCWEESRTAKMRGELYQEFASELRYALEKEEKQPNA